MPDHPPPTPAPPDITRPHPPGLWAHLRRLGPAGVLAAVAMALPLLGALVLLGYMDTIGQYLRGHGGAGVALYALGFALCAGLALVPTYASAILGGWAFGFAMGFPAALAGFLGGSLLGYAVARCAAQDRVQKLIAEHRTWQAVRDALVGSGFGRTLLIVALIRLPPNSPFALTNLVLASVKVPVGAYALGTLLGMAPRTGVVLYLAVQVRDRLAAEDAARLQVPLWLWIVGVAAALGVIAVLGLIGKHAVQRATRPRAAPLPGGAGTSE